MTGEVVADAAAGGQVPVDGGEQELAGAMVDAVQLSSVPEYLEFVDSCCVYDADRWYRGHASDGWSLSASVFRTVARKANERVMLKRFMQEARRHLPDVPSERWDWLFLAQHHQVPTRLLDWSENPLFGLYFAALDHRDVDDDPASARDGEVWVLEPTKLNAKQGFAYAGRDIPMFGIDDDLAEYSPFEGTQNLRPPVAALAARTFPRITAQWGTFTICNSSEPIDLLPDAHDFLRSAIVPLAAKPGIRSQLARLGVEDKTVYMDLFRLGKHLSDAYS